MTKLSWGTPGERFYETGVDKGVLFVDGAGYAWNGLISVSENSPGGDVTPYYLDGFKYSQLMAAEEFEATLEALSSPAQFKVCDGSFEIHAGLFATQQRRKSFNLSYRTLLGNDVSGLDLGYKIHLVYNALAGASEKANTTQQESADPLTLSWQITTLPAEVTGIRPTAHFVVDSTRANAAALLNLENLLYGTNSTAPSMPTATALVAMFP